MTWTLLLEQIANGIVVGSAYALMGGGLALIYGTMRLLNFAQGEMYMLGGFFVFFLVVQAGLSPFVGIPVAVLGVFVTAALIQRATLHYLVRREGWLFSTIAATLGISIMLQQIALHLFGERIKAIPYYIDGIAHLGPVDLPWQRVLILAVSVATMVAMGMLLRFSRFGQAVRATAQDAEAAAVAGVPTPLIHTLVFATGAALGAVAAAMLAPIYGIGPWMGVPLILKAFAVVVLGGLGSFAGAVVGGFLLGIVEAIGITITSSQWQDVISFGVLILVIWVRPRGLFGARGN